MFDSIGSNICKQCVQSHQFNAFRAGFADKTLLYIVSMLTINVIDCKRESWSKAFAYISSMFNESSTARNICVFKEFNIFQIGIQKDDPCWAD